MVEVDRFLRADGMVLLLLLLSLGRYDVGTIFLCNFTARRISEFHAAGASFLRKMEKDRVITVKPRKLRILQNLFCWLQYKQIDFPQKDSILDELNCLYVVFGHRIIETTQQLQDTKIGLDLAVVGGV